MTNCLVNNVTEHDACPWRAGHHLENEHHSRKKGRAKAGKALQRSCSKPPFAPADAHGRSLLHRHHLVLGADGKIDFKDGLVFVGIFLFWQCFHVFDVLKSNAQQNKSQLDVADRPGFLRPSAVIRLCQHRLARGLGFQDSHRLRQRQIHGLAQRLAQRSCPTPSSPSIMPGRERPGNRLHLAGWRLPYLHSPVHRRVRPCSKHCRAFLFRLGVVVLLAATLVHIFFIGAFGRLPRYMGWILTAAYAFFVWRGLLQ